MTNPLRNVKASGYVQAQNGVIRNDDGAAYSNLGIGLGGNLKLSLSQKDAIFGECELGAGTALSANAKLGYQRALSKNSNLVFTANASISRSLTEKGKSNFHIGKSYENTGNNYNITQYDYEYDWNEKNKVISGRIGFNKNTKWGGYEVGVEVGHSNSMSPSFHEKGSYYDTIEVDNNKKMEVLTDWEFGRESGERTYIAPYAEAKLNIGKTKFQSFGKVNINEVKIGLRYNL